MFRVQRLAVLVLTTLAFLGSAAAQERWQIDPSHSAAQFAVRHLGISTVRGQFNKMSGSAVFDPGNPGKTEIEAVIDPASIDTRIEMRDKDLRSAKYFDVATYPALTFKSTRVEAVGSGKLRVIGDLTMHGVTKEVTLNVDGPTQAANHGNGPARMGATATTKLNRRDFGINGGATVVSDEVEITLDLELVKAASAGSPAR